MAKAKEQMVKLVVAGNPGNPGKKKRRHNPGIRIPITIALPMLSIAGTGYNQYTRYGFQIAMHRLMKGLFGLDLDKSPPGFTTKYLVEGAYPLVVGALAHKGANWLGINRAIARAGIPVIRI